VENRPVPVRLDVFLDVSCLCKTRSEAQRMCKGGKVEVNGNTGKPHREVKPGDVIDITRQFSRRMRVKVVAVTSQHIPKAEARQLYEDVTPPPSPEERAMLDMIRLAGPHRRAPRPSTPDRNERRRLRREKEGNR
jgi:ribosome-associated heat shock protein Hsp15